MGYKESIFNLKFAVGQEQLAYYNTYTGALALFDEPLSELLIRDNYPEPLAQGFVVAESIDEVARVLDERESEIEGDCCQTQVFEIAPTLKCQAACTYCFQKLLKNTPQMDIEAAASTAEFIKEAIDAVQPMWRWSGLEESLP